MGNKRNTSTKIFGELHRWKHRGYHGKCVTTYRKPGTPIYGKIKYRTPEQRAAMKIAFDPNRRDWKNIDRYWIREKEKYYK